METEIVVRVPPDDVDHGLFDVLLHLIRIFAFDVLPPEKFPHEFLNMSESAPLSRFKVMKAVMDRIEVKSIIDSELIRGHLIDLESLFAKRQDVFGPDREAFFPPLLLFDPVDSPCILLR